MPRKEDLRREIKNRKLVASDQQSKTVVRKLAEFVRDRHILSFNPIFREEFNLSALELIAASVKFPEQSGGNWFVEEGAIDVVVVPGLAFTQSGFRLGRGLGFYDKTLAAFDTALSVGVCLDEQLVESLPVEPHDQPVDVVITPSFTYNAKRLSSS